VLERGPRRAGLRLHCRASPRGGPKPNLGLAGTCASLRLRARVRAGGRSQGLRVRDPSDGLDPRARVRDRDLRGPIARGALRKGAGARRGLHRRPRSERGRRARGGESGRGRRWRSGALARSRGRDEPPGRSGARRTRGARTPLGERVGARARPGGSRRRLPRTGHPAPRVLPAVHPLRRRLGRGTNARRGAERTQLRARGVPNPKLRDLSARPGGRAPTLNHTPPMFGALSKAKMPTPADALPGRGSAVEVPELHFVNGKPLVGPWPGEMQSVVFGLGCFWGAERRFWQQAGVYSTAVGYAAGYTPNPTYREVCSGGTGHNEVVLVVYDPAQISFEALLEAFWESHDPTQGMRQGNDMGTQYRSGIYVDDAARLEIAQDSKRAYQAALTQAGLGAITTEILELPAFYYAEDYHQQYLAKNPGGY